MGVLTVGVEHLFEISVVTSRDRIWFHTPRDSLFLVSWLGRVSTVSKDEVLAIWFVGLVSSLKQIEREEENGDFPLSSNRLPLEGGTLLVEPGEPSVGIVLLGLGMKDHLLSVELDEKTVQTYVVVI